MANTAARPGRKPRIANQGQRASLGLKVTPEIKNKLDAAAKANGRTQSQEAEARIEHSFRGEDYLDQAMELAYGPRLAGLITVIGRAMHQIGQYSEFEAARNGEATALPRTIAAWRQVLFEVDRALDEFSPETREQEEWVIDASRIIVDGLFDMVKKPEAAGDTMVVWAKAQKSRLGDDFVARIRLNKPSSISAECDQ